MEGTESMKAAHRLLGGKKFVVAYLGFPFVNAA